MTVVSILTWSAWSPGLESEDDWRAWARDPRPLESKGSPRLEFMPALQRRRCDQLSRMMLHAIHRCCPKEQLATVPSVFASRLGSFGTMASMLEQLASNAPLSPASFSHSVHNTTAGLFSIWAKNHRASTSISGGLDVFSHGMLAAAAILQRNRQEPVLYVVGDEAMPELFQEVSDTHQRGAYAVALLLSAGEEGERIEFRLDTVKPNKTGELAQAAAKQHPDAVEFVRWLVSTREQLSITHAPLRWTWRRTGAVG